MALSPVIGRALLEIGKALGKAIIAGVGLELARAVSGHVKRAVGPREAQRVATDKADDRAGDDDESSNELERMRRENAALRREVEELQRARAAPHDHAAPEVHVDPSARR